MDDFQRYLDLYAPGDATLRAALDGRLAPSAHWERYFNVNFPRPYTGLGGLGAVGDRLPQPAAATLPNGDVAPPAAWLQRALNALAAPNQIRLVADGVAGPQTLERMLFVWRYLSSSLTREQRGRTPYLVTVDGHRTIGMSRDMLLWIVNQNLVEVAGPSTITVTPGPVELDPLPPTSSASSTGLVALLAVAAALGFWYSR